MSADTFALAVGLGLFFLVMAILCCIIAIKNNIQASRWQDGHPRVKLGAHIDPRFRDQRNRVNPKGERYH